MREEEEKRGGEDGASVYASCGSALRRRPVDKPDWKLCGLCTHIHKHTHTHTDRALPRTATAVISPDRTASLLGLDLRPSCTLCARRTCGRGPTPRCCCRRREPCLSCAPSCSAGFPPASSPPPSSLTLSLTHTARSQRCLLTQEVLFIRQSDRDLWGARQRAHSKRRLCQASEDE